MSRYIPCDKIQKLREAAHNGDEVAKRILLAQLDDDTDFSEDLENYFKPQPEPEEQKVEEVAETPQEEVKQPETEEIQNVSNIENTPVLTGKLPEDEISSGILSLISSCDKKTLDIANNTEISDATKKGALSILQEIKQSCLDNLEKFGKLMSSISKKVVEEDEEIQ